MAGASGAKASGGAPESQLGGKKGDGKTLGLVSRDTGHGFGSGEAGFDRVTVGRGRVTCTAPAARGAMSGRGRVMLMQFIVQRPHGDTAGVRAQVQALSDLTDPDMLVGIDPLDVPRILNFQIP